MESIDSLVAAHLAAWNSPPGSERERAITQVYAPDVYVGEPGQAYHGHDGMDRAISGLQVQVPGATIVRSGPVQTTQDLVTYTWELGTPGHPAIASGRDVLRIADGKITSLHVVIDAP
jgi:SnoaL-like protein